MFPAVISYPCLIVVVVVIVVVVEEEEVLAAKKTKGRIDEGKSSAGDEDLQDEVESQAKMNEAMKKSGGKMRSIVPELNMDGEKKEPLEETTSKG